MNLNLSFLLNFDANTEVFWSIDGRLALATIVSKNLNYFRI
jgi:hypothetical protein